MEVVKRSVAALVLALGLGLAFANAQSRPRVESLWIDGYCASSASEVSSFVLEGRGSLPVQIVAFAESIAGYGTAEEMRSIRVTLSRLSGSEWEQLVTFDLDQADFGSDEGGFPGARMGELSLDLVAGSYLLNFAVPSSISIQTSLQLELSPVEGVESPRLVNAAILGYLGGSRLKREIGFSQTGEGQRNLLVRNVGPTLQNFGIGAVASNPALLIRRDGMKMASNDDWWSGVSISQAGMREAMQRMGAFRLNDESSDAALSIDSVAGAYQVISRAETVKSGYEIVEVYLD